MLCFCTGAANFNAKGYPNKPKTHRHAYVLCCSVLKPFLFPSPIFLLPPHPPSMLFLSYTRERWPMPLSHEVAMRHIFHPLLRRHLYLITQSCLLPKLSPHLWRSPKLASQLLPTCRYLLWKCVGVDIKSVFYSFTKMYSFHLPSSYFPLYVSP